MKFADLLCSKKNALCHSKSCSAHAKEACRGGCRYGSFTEVGRSGVMWKLRSRNLLHAALLWRGYIIVSSRWWRHPLSTKGLRWVQAFPQPGPTAIKTCALSWQKSGPFIGEMARRKQRKRYITEHNQSPLRLNVTHGVLYSSRLSICTYMPKPKTLTFLCHSKSPFPQCTISNQYEMTILYNQFQEVHSSVVPHVSKSLHISLMYWFEQFSPPWMFVRL